MLSPADLEVNWNEIINFAPLSLHNLIEVSNLAQRLANKVPYATKNLLNPQKQKLLLVHGKLLFCKHELDYLVKLLAHHLQVFHRQYLQQIQKLVDIFRLADKLPHDFSGLWLSHHVLEVRLLG